MTKEKHENIHKDHRKRVKQKFLEHGISSFSEHEILEFLLFFSKPQGDTNALAHELINNFGSLQKVLDSPYESLKEVNGVGEHSATFLKLLPQVFKQYQAGKLDGLKTLSTYYDCFELASQFYCNSVVEELYVVCINAKNSILAYKQIATGLQDKVDVDIRQITDFILKNNCSRILVYHNHPSNVMAFSTKDEELTTTIYTTCILNGIDVVDHILYTVNGCVSMNKNGILPEIKRDVLNRLQISPQSKIYKTLYCSSVIEEIKD